MNIIRDGIRVIGDLIQRNPKQGRLAQIPPEVIHANILNILDAKDLVSLSLVNKRMAEVVINSQTYQVTKRIYPSVLNPIASECNIQKSKESAYDDVTAPQRRIEFLVTKDSDGNFKLTSDAHDSQIVAKYKAEDYQYIKFVRTGGPSTIYIDRHIRSYLKNFKLMSINQDLPEQESKVLKSVEVTINRILEKNWKKREFLEKKGFRQESIRT